MVIFDLDDTLFKEIDYLKSAYREIAAKLAETGIANAYGQMMQWRNEGVNVFEAISSHYNIHFPIATMVSWYRLHQPTISLTNDCKELLDTLAARNTEMGILTDGRSTTQRNKIAALGLQHYIAENNIVISEEFGSEKPDERNYRYFSDRNPHEHYVYIGDNPRKDFITPNRLGWLTIGIVDNGENIHRQDNNLPNEFQPRLWVQTYREVLQTIDTTK